jgi:hypothetical protein
MCGKSARTDLRGGCRVTGIPTAITGHTTLAHWLARVTVEYQRVCDVECMNLLWTDLAVCHTLWNSVTRLR